MKKPQTWQQWTLIGAAFAIVILLLGLPLALIFAKALGAGWNMLVAQFADGDMQHAIKLTLLVAVLTVPINAIFGIMLAWCVTHYRFRGRNLLITLIDIPYATSPVVAGLCYLVVYGAEGLLGPWLSERQIQLMFAWPGLVMVTVFVTSPFVARLLIPVMGGQGSNQEQAALTLGARGWQIFRYVTLPRIKWGVLYAAVITNARAIGEFGAVSVVSGAIRGKTLTLPLLVEQLNEDHKVVGAFAAALLLACMALATIVLKVTMEAIQARRLQQGIASAA